MQSNATQIHFDSNFAVIRVLFNSSRFGSLSSINKLLVKIYLTCLLTYLLTYLLTPWSTVLLEKLTGSAASQEIPRIFGIRKFLTVLTSARHLSLS